MKYMLVMYTVPADAEKMSKEQRDEILEKHAALRIELEKTGELQNGAGLLYLADSKSVALQAGALLIAPAADSRDAAEMTAYYIVECDEQRALAIAQRLLDFHVIRVEVRFIHDSTGM